MIRKIVSILAAALSISMAAAAQDDVKAMFTKDIAANAAVSSIDCRFTQTRSVAVLANEVKESGDFTFRRPGTIRLQFDGGDYILFQGETFEMRSDGHTTTMKTASNPMLKELSRMLGSCMSGDLSGVMAGFDSTVSATAKTYSVVLVPKNRRAGSMMKQMEMEFDRKDMSLDWMKMVEGNGDWTKYTFTDKKISK